MKVNTNYSEMTDAQLLQELDRRADAFGDNLSTYTTGAIPVVLDDHEAYYSCSDGLGRLFIVSDPHDIGSEDVLESEIIEKKHPKYREILLDLLQAKFIIYDAFDKERNREDQAYFLEDIPDYENEEEE